MNKKAVNHKAEEPVQEKKPHFWPPRNNYVVKPLMLSTKWTKNLMSVTKQMKQVVAAADAIRSLQDFTCSEEVTNLIHNLKLWSADLLDEISNSTLSVKDKYTLSKRADILRGACLNTLLEEIMDVKETELFSFCGELSTWHTKSDKLYFSAFFGIPDGSANNLISTADLQFDKVQAYIQKEISKDIIISKPPDFLVVYLALCGGEANRYPKHFSYFLPEDEGVKYSVKKNCCIQECLFCSV